MNKSIRPCKNNNLKSKEYIKYKSLEFKNVNYIEKHIDKTKDNLENNVNNIKQNISFNIFNDLNKYYKSASKTRIFKLKECASAVNSDNSILNITNTKNKRIFSVDKSNSNDNIFKSKKNNKISIKLDLINNKIYNESSNLKNNTNYKSIYPICLYCKNILNNPCCCYKCNTIMCKDCFKIIIYKYNKCFVCFCFIEYSLLLTLEEYVEKILKVKLLKCPYNMCCKYLKSSQYCNHLNSCPYKELIISEAKSGLQLKNKTYINDNEKYHENILSLYSDILKIKFNNINNKNLDHLKTYNNSLNNKKHIKSLNKSNLNNSKHVFDNIFDEIENLENNLNSVSKETNKLIYNIIYQN